MFASAARRPYTPSAAVLCAVLVLAACRTGVPVVDANPGPSSVSGTITGTLSTADGKAGIGGRKITAVNLDTGVRLAVTTTDTGGYTLKVAPGRYRIDVELAAGETLVRDPGTFTVGRSELQHDVDIRVGVKRAGVTRIYQPPLATRAPSA